ncbi:MAG: response regulator [Hyphomonadaceae bacterium]
MSDRYRILIVEDDALIAMELEERLAEMGYEVVGPALTIEDAERLVADGSRLDAALLDANLAGKSSVPVGAALAGKGVPVAFCTGYDQIRNLPPELAAAPILTKPIGDADLIAGLKRLLS